MILRQLVEIRVDTEKFDLSYWASEAAAMGFEESAENGLWTWTEEIMDEHVERGVTVELVPADPYVSES